MSNSITQMPNRRTQPGSNIKKSVERIFGVVELSSSKHRYVILECEVKWDLGSITTNKASGGDGILSYFKS